MLSLDDLRAFVAVAQEGSLKAAAERLCKTQSAISQALRRLEEALSVTLFDRSGYRVSLTAQGEELMKRSKLLLQEAGQLKQFASRLAAGQEQSYRIAIESSVPHSCFIPVVAQLSTAFRDTVIHVFYENVEGAFMRLERGEVDLAIAPWHAISTVYRTIESRPLGTLQIVNAIHRDLLGEGPMDDDELLRRLRTVRQVVVKSSVEGGRDTFGVIDGGCYLHVTDLTLKIDLIRRGLGWGRVPAHRVHDELSAGSLVTAHLPTLPGELSVEVHGMRKMASAHGPVAAAAWEALAAAHV